jgi:hypothetical protein
MLSINIQERTSVRHEHFFDTEKAFEQAPKVPL